MAGCRGVAVVLACDELSLSEEEDSSELSSELESLVDDDEVEVVSPDEVSECSSMMVGETLEGRGEEVSA